MCKKQNKRAVIFYELPADLDIVLFKYELEKFGEIQFFDMPRNSEGKWDRTCIVAYLFDTDNEKLLCNVPRVVFCGVHLKARFGYHQF